MAKERVPKLISLFTDRSTWRIFSVLLALSLSACSLDANLLDLKMLGRKIAVPSLEHPTVPEYFNDELHELPISGKCPEGVAQVVLEYTGIQKAIYQCNEGRFEGAIDVTDIPKQDGDHEFTLRPDGGDSYSWVIVRDTKAPTLLGLSDDTIWVQAKTWTWGCDEECTYRFEISGSSTVPSFSSDFASTTTAAVKEGTGTFYLHVQAKDRAGNKTLKSVSVQLDNTLPSAPTEVGYKIHSNHLDKSPPIYFREGSDIDSGIERHEARIVKESDGKEITAWALFTLGSSIYATLSTNTRYHVEVRAVDKAGNISAVARGDGWLADNTPPTAPANLSVGSIPSNLTSTPPLFWEASSDGDGGGVSQYQVQVLKSSDHSVVKNWEALSSGGSLSGLSLESKTDYYFKVKAIDFANNKSVESVSLKWTSFEDCTGLPPNRECLGSVWDNGAIWVGLLPESISHAGNNGGKSKYMIMPGGCNGSTNNPTCSGEMDGDEVKKTWNDGTNNWEDIAGIENILSVASQSHVLGDINTNILASSKVPGSDGSYAAAKYCADMVFAGYNDWYLPSKSELAYLQCKSDGLPVEVPLAEEPTCSAYGGNTDELKGFVIGEPYWTSTEFGNGDAWGQLFVIGDQYKSPKQNSQHVRCVRRF